ncbi:hypothetical protein GCM10010191_57700 [Actinomadura vinacea]|uniref:DUF1707 domain-containing protein n=1 Tax=Actinomadura vinacea TaxID=115336 RepID=A0ABN3JR85_9ACTN
MTTAYFEDLAGLLHARGLPAGEVDETVEHLAAHAGGADPEERYGPVRDLAERLTGSAFDGAPSPETDPTARTWTWTADAFADRARLYAAGEEGWEVERVDGDGRFVAHRDLADPRRWEYRRETGGAPSPDGWEACGTWLCYRYYKRPKQNAPAGSLDQIPERSSLPLTRMVVGYVAALAVVGAAWALLGGSGIGYLGGFFVGAALAGAALVIVRTRRR